MEMRTLPDDAKAVVSALPLSLDALSTLPA
jgi:hypothetical protein